VFISRGEGVINLFVGSWISLAEKVAQETSAKGHGERVGAVVVDSNASWSGPVPVAVAGDGRWIECGKDTTSSTSYSGSKKQDKGNPAAHAVMRAIGMVARQRVERGGRTVKDGIESPLGEGLQLYEKPPVIERSKDAPEPNIFHDQPATDLEEFVYKESLLPPGGYLCSGLEMYLTHEPCVMCSMALLHSRFDRVVIARKMPKTGAMVGETARGRTPLRENVNGRTPTSHDPSEDGGLGYGLFWRPELNWKMLVWEWIDDNKTMSSDAKSRRIHA
jgi:tRNA-specific adenosine deaminase 3